MLGPPLLVGDRVAHLGEEEPVLGSVRWLGRLPDLFPHQLVAGLMLDEPQASCSVISMIGRYHPEEEQERHNLSH